MNFDQKLNALMHLFKISNSQLARGINVDASLVSRWKSGERKISINSPHIPVLATYFLHLNAYQYQREYLERIITARLPEKQRVEEAQRIHVLADWLVSEESPDPQPDEQPEQLAQSVSLINNLSNILIDPGSVRASVIQAMAAAQPAAAGQPEADWQPNAQPGTAASYEIFEGRAGRRQAVINFLNQVLNSDKPLDILLTSEDDTRWITEDRNFAVLWAQLLGQAIAQGHQITIIHVLSRRIGEIMTMLNYWMPLHMAGRLNSYFYPRYGERRIRQTMFIVRDQMALISHNIADYTGPELNFVYNDLPTVQQFTRQFMVHVGQCRPLFAVFTAQNAKAYFERVLELSKKPGAVFCIRHQLNIRLLSPIILSQYLHKNSGMLSESQLTAWLASQQQSFYNQLEREPYVDILPVSLLENIQQQKYTYVGCCETFSERPIQIRMADTQAWLQQTVDTLRKYDNYEVYLCSDTHAIDDLQINITYKENTIAQFASSAREKRLNSIIQISENNILHSMSYYFDNFIQQIAPSLRNRNDVILRLERLIANLAGSATRK